MHSPRVRTAWALVCALLLALCTLGTAARYAAVTATTLAPLTVLVLQLRQHREASRTGWVTMAAGLAVLAAHNAHNQIALATTGAPAVGLLTSAGLTLGLVLLLTGGIITTLPYARRDPGGMLDAAIIGLATASLVWGLVLRPAHLRLGSTNATMAYELVLVLLVTALTGAVVRAVVVAPEARTPALLLLVAVCAMNGADMAFTLTLDPATGLASWSASALCVTALLAFAMALAQPSARALAGPAHPTNGLTGARLVYLGLAMSVGPVLAGAQTLAGSPIDVASLSVGGVAIVTLALIRIGLLARRHADAERTLRELASVDALTGLANRRALTEHLSALLDRVAERTAACAVVLYLDLDDFKAINDTYGHATGDRLLTTIAERIRGCLRPGDLVGRFGGDEFVVVLECDRPADADRVVRAVETVLSEPVALGGVLTVGGVSIGVAAAAPGDRVDASTLLDRADAQMYRTKRAHQQPAEEPVARIDPAGPDPAGRPSPPTAAGPAPVLP